MGSMTENEKWAEAKAAWSEVKSGTLSSADFWSIVHALVSGNVKAA